MMIEICPRAVNRRPIRGLCHFLILSRSLLTKICAVLLSTKTVHATVEEQGYAEYRVVVVEVDGVKLQRIVATVDDQDYWIMGGHDGDGEPYPATMAYIEILETGDFDDDGHSDAWVRMHSGGNEDLSRYHLISHHGESIFSMTTHDRLYTRGGYQILEEENGNTLFKVYVAGDGAGNTDRIDGISYFQAHHGKLTDLSQVSNVAQIPTIVEITSESFKETGETGFEYDVDGDGDPDQVICEYWSRWGDIVCEISTTSNGILTVDGGVDHLGVAFTRSNGLSDIIVNWIGKLVYDGTGYSPVR